ncbi:MAG TPA: hypothetical protein VLV88_11940 [Terriglobales bacterium]|nr:hypothetical protein [Terriglobales bacterium]
MRGPYWMRIVALLPVALLAVTPVIAQQTSQTGDPVADAARKAREQKKNEPKPKKVFTDDDVKPAEAPPAQAQASAQGQAAGSGQTGATGAAAASKEDPNGETAWRKRFAEQRAKIAKAQEELDVLQRELEKAQVQYYPDPQKAMTQQLTRNDINEKSAKIAAKQKEIEQLNNELSEMEDQLRKGGGDPGWAR